MHWLFLKVMEVAFDLPLAPFHKSLNENLRKEIDFVLEAANAKKCSENFVKVGRKDVYVPKIYDDYTSKRTLVTEWIDGIKITDEARLEKEGFDITRVLSTTVEAFAE